MMFDVRLDRFRVGLTEPIHTARGTIFERQGFVLVVHDDAGNWGRGELAPLPGWSTVDLDEAQAQLESVAGEIRTAGFPSDLEGYAPEVRAAVGASRLSLEAAVDDKPLWQRLGGETGRVAVNALVVGRDPGDLAANAAAAVEQGFGTLKVKMGMGDDDQRIAALADVGDDRVRVRLDANGAWSVSEARARLEGAVSVLGSRLEYVEDPVSSLVELRELRAICAVPVAADEVVRGTDDAHSVLVEHLADCIVAKPPMLGGIDVCLALADLARSHDADVVISSLYDGPVGLASWCHLAAAVGGARAHGVGTATLLADAGAAHLVPRRGWIQL